MLFTKLLAYLHRFLAWGTLAISATVLFGWATENVGLIQVAPFFAPMAFNTALCLVFLSISLLLPDLKFDRLGRVFSGLVFIIGLVTLSQYLFSYDAGVDTLLWDPFFTVGMAFPGRMPVSTAVCFILLGMAWTIRNPRYAFQMFYVATASLVIGFSTIGLLGYAFKFNAEYGWGSYSRMAFHTSVCLLMLSLAALLHLRLEVRQVSLRRSALVPFYVLIVGVLLTIAIWQLLIQRDQDRNRTFTQIRLETLKESMDNAFLPLVKAMDHMARRFASGGYHDSKIWAVDAEGYIEEFQGLRRMYWVDPGNYMRWVYPLDAAGAGLANTRVGTNNKLLVQQIDEVAHGKSVAISKVFTLRTGGRGVVLFVPILKGGAYKGAVGCSILTEPFLSQVVKVPGYDVEIHEGDKVIFNRGQSDPVFARDWTTRGTYKGLDAEWSIKLTPTANEIRANTSAVPAVVLLFGVSVSVLLGVALIFYNRSRGSESEARKALEWKKAGIDSSSLMFISLDENTVIREMNVAAEKMLGYTTEELAGKTSPLMFYDPAEVRAFQQKMESELGTPIRLGRDFMDALFKLGYHRATEWTQISRSGRRYSVINATSEIHDEKGQLTGYLQILEDVTELKEKEQLLREQEMKIVASSRLASLGEMAAGIAHEINNPLAIINGHVGVLRKNLMQKGLSEDTEISKKIDSIESVVQRIAKIIKGLRTYAHETDVKEDEWMKIETVVEDTLSFSRERFRSEGVELQTHIPSDLQVLGQPHQISQVILNLLNNALDAVQNSKVKTVSIEAAVRNNGVEISVSDSGPGVPYDLRSRIMQPFFTTKEVGKGVGLGLSISQGIIQAHGGRFYLDENSARTRFVIWFPKS